MALGVACGDSRIEYVDGGVDAGMDSEAPQDASGADAGSDAAVPCNDVPNDAPTVPGRFVLGSTSNPQGGTIVDGTYWLTDFRWVVPPPDGGFDAGSLDAGDGGGFTLGTFKNTLKVQGNEWRLVSSVNGSAELRATQTASVAGNMLSLQQTCPSSGMSVTPYTATATSIVIELPALNNLPPSQLEYTKQ